MKLTATEISNLNDVVEQYQSDHYEIIQYEITGIGLETAVRFYDRDDLTGFLVNRDIIITDYLSW